jgi:CNT family concentrative nucleoside transporter
MPIFRSFLGILIFLLIAFLLSNNRRKISMRVVIVGILLQFSLAGIILGTEVGQKGLGAFSSGVAQFLGFGAKGAEMVFGPLTTWEDPGPDALGNAQPIRFYPSYAYENPAIGKNLSAEAMARWPITFALRALPTIIYFSAFMAILYHLGVVQWVVRQMARFMSWAMGVSGAESLAMAANVFVGQTEAPLVVKPYIKTMTNSELMALMSGGFATIAGSVLAAYIGMLTDRGTDFAGHLLAASFMSAPAAFVMAKIMIPEAEKSVTAGNVTLRDERTTTNILDAAATGTSDGLALFLNVMAMLIAFVALMALVNWPLMVLFPDVAGGPLSLERIFGWVFAPFAWAIGVDWSECTTFGALLGTKVGVNEFVAFNRLGGDLGSELSPRAQRLAAYALCGFANFASIGIQIGGISPLAPERRKDIARLAFKAMIAGAFASWMTACVAGAFL